MSNDERKKFESIEDVLKWADHRNPPQTYEKEVVLLKGKKIEFTFNSEGEYQFYGIK